MTQLAKQFSAEIVLSANATIEEEKTKNDGITKCEYRRLNGARDGT